MRSRIVINVADVREVNVQLSTGEITESVSVEYTAYSVKTVGAEIAGLTSGDQCASCRSTAATFLQLTLLQPGVTATEGLSYGWITSSSTGGTPPRRRRS